MEVPDQIKPADAGDYLAVMTKAVFQSGLSWNVVESKWPGIQSAFHDFNPLKVSEMNPDDIDKLTNDTRVIRHRKKIEATVHNAAQILDLEEVHGSFRNYLRSHPDFEATVRSLRQHFNYLGETGCYFFLYVVGEVVPPRDEWAASRGVKFPA